MRCASGKVIMRATVLPDLTLPADADLALALLTYLLEVLINDYRGGRR